MRYIVSVLMLVFIAASCTTISLIPIEVREPALVTFPQEVKNLLIVNNSASQKEEEVSVNGEVPSKKISLISTDSAKMILLKSMQKFMSEEKYFDQVILYTQSTNSGSGDEVKPLSPLKIQSLCREKKADAVVVMDLFAVSADLESDVNGYSGLYRLAKSSIGSVFKVYNNDGTNLSRPIVHVDSLFRELTLDFFQPQSSINEVNSLVSEITIKAADKISCSFIPSWKTQERWFYSDNSKEMKRAADLLKQSKWEEAATIWADLYEKEKRADKKIRLTSNIALANEYLDDIDNAVEWIGVGYGLLPPKSHNSELAIQVLTYYELLKTRQKNKSKLYEQLGLETIEGVN